jgi:hypothetical protein
MRSSAEEQFDVLRNGTNLRFGRYEVDFVKGHCDFNCGIVSWGVMWHVLI